MWRNRKSHSFKSVNNISFIFKLLSSSTYNLKQFLNNIHAISKEIFPFLCKKIIASYYWEPTGNKEIIIQSLIVDDVLLSSRLLMINSFCLIIKNDKDSSNKLVELVPDACWQILITWFIDKKHNNMFQRNFLNILENTFKQASENLLIKIIVKLNLIGLIFESFDQVFKNEVAYMKLPLESYFCFCVKIIKLIDNTMHVLVSKIIFLIKIRVLIRKKQKL